MTRSSITKKDIQRVYQQMMNGIESYSVILLDNEGTILTWNKGVEKIKGYTADEIIGQHISMFYLPEDRQINLPATLLQEAREKGIAKHVGRRIRKNGQIFWGSIEITALRDEKGTCIGFTKLARELKDETDIGNFWFDIDGILHSKASAAPQTSEKLLEFRNMILSVVGTERVCGVMDIRDGILVDDSFDIHKMTHVYKAVAFVSNEPVDKNTLIVFNLMKGQLPCSIFHSRDDATRWARQFIKL